MSVRVFNPEMCYHCGTYAGMGSKCPNCEEELDVFTVVHFTPEERARDEQKALKRILARARAKKKTPVKKSYTYCPNN